MGIAIIGIGLAVATANRFINFDTSHFQADLAFVDAIGGSRIAPLPAGSCQAAEGKEEEGEMLHLFSERYLILCCFHYATEEALFRAFQ